MPYIPDKCLRKRLDEHVFKIFDEAKTGGSLKGNLNYSVTRLIHLFVSGYWSADRNNRTCVGLCYDAQNDAVGLLESIKLELANAVVNPYENGKRAENGPVSELDGDSRGDEPAVEICSANENEPTVKVCSAIAYDDAKNTFTKFVSLVTLNDKKVISFGGPIEYYAEDLVKHYPYDEPHCIDMNGLNHGGVPNVCVSSFTMNKILETLVPEMLA